MKVHELIEALKKITDQESEVVTEGCDCFGDVDSVMYQLGETYLMRKTTRIAPPTLWSGCTKPKEIPDEFKELLP